MAVMKEAHEIRALTYLKLEDQCITVALDEFVTKSWEHFCAEFETGATALSSNTYTYEDWQRTCAADLPRLSRKFSRQLLSGVSPWYAAPLLEPAEAQQRLTGALRDFLKKPRQTVIRITAGAGKTTTTASALGNFLVKHRKKVVHWYVKRHSLGYDIQAGLKETHPQLKVVVVEGRKSENCARIKEVELVRRKNIPVASTLCGPSDDDDDVALLPSTSALDRPRCPFYNTCRYQAVIREAETANMVIFAHAQLKTKLDKRLRKPDFIIIDEAFFDELIQVHCISSADLNSVPEGKAVIDALKQTEIDPKLYLSRRNITAGRLRAAADRIQSNWQGSIERLKQFTGANDIECQIACAPIRPPVLIALRAVATELDRKRPGFYSLRLRGDDLVVRTRAPKHRLIRRTLVLDATADLRIYNIVLGAKLVVHDIAVKRRGHMTQIHNVLMNKMKLLSSSGHSYLMKVQRIVDGLGSNEAKTGVIFTYNAVKDKIRLPSGWEIDHFGNLRGTNDYKHHDFFIIIGRWRFPPDVIEDKVASLVHGTELVPDMSGGQVDKARGYRMRNGELKGRTIQVYEDPLWQAIDEQYREAEVEQAIDRARLVWNGENKRVYVLTSLVGRFEVDVLATLDELAGWSKFERAHEKVGPVVPMKSYLAR